MANYSFVINSKFRPFTYEELVAPIKYATEEHNKREEQLSALSSQAETIRERANAEELANPNSKWVKKYREYADNLDKAATELARYGIKGGSRQALMQLRKDYFNSVDPAVKAIEQQKKLVDTQFAMDPTKRMVWGETPTVDQLIGDMSLKPVGYSGKDAYEQAVMSAKGASARNVINAITRDPKLAGYFMKIKEAGYNAQTMDELRSIPAIKEAEERVIEQFEGFNGLSKLDKAKMRKEVEKGIFDGVIYNKDITPVYDQYADAIRKEQLAIAKGGSKGKEPKIPRTRITTIPEKNKKFNADALEASVKLAQYFKGNGELKDEYVPYFTQEVPKGTPFHKGLYNNLVKFFGEDQAANIVKDASYGVGTNLYDLVALRTEEYQQNGALEDTRLNPVYYYDLTDPSERKKATNFYKSISDKGHKNFKKLGKDDNDNWIEIDDAVSSQDMLEGDKVVSALFMQNGKIFAQVEDEDGNKEAWEVPKGVYPEAYSTLISVEQLRQKMGELRGTETTLSDAERDTIAKATGRDISEVPKSLKVTKDVEEALKSYSQKIMDRESPRLLGQND